jgi:hypothetical protein
MTINQSKVINGENYIDVITTSASQAPTRSGRSGGGDPMRKRKELNVDRRLYNGRLALVISEDPVRDMLRVRDEALHAARCRDPIARDPP